MRHQFNTGRGYSEHGQRIVVVREKDNAGREWLRFRDHDRFICGAIPLAAWARTFEWHAVEALVMANYDHGNYEGAVGGDLTWDDTL